MKEADWAERLRKRELRVMHRERVMKNKAEKRESTLRRENEA
jgi:hypothetical protein